MHTLCLWALGTWQLFQIEKRVPTTLSLLGYSERLQGGTLQQLGMRRAGGEWAREQAGAGLHQAQSSACKCSASFVHVLNPGLCHALSSAQCLLLLLSGGKQPLGSSMELAWSSPFAFQGCSLVAGSTAPPDPPCPLSLCLKV